MTTGKHADEYRKNAVLSASPLRLIIMLYDGALRQMEAGKAAIQSKELEAQNASLQKAQRIVIELMSILDMDKGGEIANNLLALYTYVLEQLVLANVEDDPIAVERAMITLTELRDGWVLLEQGLQQPHEVPLAA